jgi:hypothetical protein
VCEWGAEQRVARGDEGRWQVEPRRVLVPTGHRVGGGGGRGEQTWSQGCGRVRRNTAPAVTLVDARTCRAHSKRGGRRREILGGGRRNGVARLKQ